MHLLPDSCFRRMTSGMVLLRLAVSLYIPQHTAGVWNFAPYVFRSAATMGAPVLCDVRVKDLSPAVAKLAFDELRELRPCWFGDYYPLLAIDASEEACCGWQFDRPELGKGFAALFRRPTSPDAVKTVKFWGLDPAAYEVTLAADYDRTNTRTMWAAELTRLEVKIDPTPGDVLVKYRKIKK
jgi:alpha-galactosidase